MPTTRPPALVAIGLAGVVASACVDGSTTPVVEGTRVDERLATSGVTARDLDDGCPADAPRAWVGCEDFDGIDDPALQLPEWLALEGGFAVEPGGVQPGSRALRVNLVPGFVYGGRVTLRFGAGPEAVGVDAPEQHFDEIWLRYRVRTADDWPGHAIGDLGEVIAMNAADWAIAAEMAIRSEDSQRLEPLGWSCVQAGALRCDGRNDWRGGLKKIWARQGDTVWFDAAHAGQWLCVEAHMRLNTPGVADGEAQVWIDEALQIGIDGVDFRGTWTGYGLNALRFTNYTHPPARPLSFWIDDVVVSTARVGCG